MMPDKRGAEFSSQQALAVAHQFIRNEMWREVYSVLQIMKKSNLLVISSQMKMKKKINAFIQTPANTFSLLVNKVAIE